MNLETIKRRNDFKRWLNLDENTIKRYDRILAGEGNSRNQEEVNNALKNIGGKGFVYDLTDLTELKEVREKCRAYKRKRPDNTGGSHPSAAVGNYIKFLKCF